MRLARFIDQNPRSLGEFCVQVIHTDIKRGAMFGSSGTGHTAVGGGSVDHKQSTIYMQHILSISLNGRI